MEYLKKIAVLNQVVEGYSLSQKRINAICRIEIENGVSTLYLSAVNFKPAINGQYKLFVADQRKKIFYIDLGKHPQSIRHILEPLPQIENGFSAGVFYIENNLPVLVAFYGNKDCLLDAPAFKKAVYEKMEKLNKSQSLIDCSLENLSASGIDSIDDSPLPIEYNDEAVATENYYLNDDCFKEKLKIFEIIDNENVRTENELFDSPSIKKEKENEDCSVRLQNEANHFEGKFNSPNTNYYQSARQEIEQILEKFPTEETLEKNLPESRFVKVNYSENKYYVVGVIKDKGKEKYVCYGIPAKYSIEPPKELKGFCSFIPLSIFDLTGDGYWMMFQDAITGECVKKA